jgi:hypothetical protein
VKFKIGAIPYLHALSIAEIISPSSIEKLGLLFM